MENSIFTLVFLTLFSLGSHAQTVEFDNAGGDGKWSNTANWIGGALPTDANTVKISSSGKSSMDADLTILQMVSVADTQIIENGGKTLTIDRGQPQWGIMINEVDSGGYLKVDCDVVFDNNTDGANQLYLQANGEYTTVEMGENSTLELITRGQTAGKGEGVKVLLNGKIFGDGPFFFGPGTTGNEFGSTADLSGLIGEVRLINGSKAIVNMADDAIFRGKGHKLQANTMAVPGELTLNGANNFQGYFKLVEGSELIVNVNANQPDMDSIVFEPNSTLILNLDSAVTDVTFGDNSMWDWSTSKFVINNFRSNVISFGGLTNAQLDSSIIAIDGNNDTIAIELTAFGFLQEVGYVSARAIEDQTSKRITYPTVTSGMVYFNSSVNELKVINIAGTMVMQFNSIENDAIDLSNLTSGMYFILIEEKAERIIIR